MDYRSNKLFVEAINSIKNFKYELAFQKLQMLYRNFSFDPVIVFYYGYVLYLLDEKKAALKIWNRLNKAPETRELFFILKAFLKVKERNIADAVKILLDWLTIRNDSKKARSFLAKIKKANDLKTFSKYLKIEDVIGELPYFNIKYKDPNKSSLLNYFDLSLILKVMIALVMLLIILIIINKYFLLFNIFSFSKNKYDRINTLYLPVEKNVKTVIFYKDQKEIEKDFFRLKRFIARKEYNQAMLLINKILNSNAKLITKKRAELFKDFLKEPNFDELKFNPSFQEVLTKPFLYKNLFIKWNGIVNTINKNKKSFTTLVYEKSDVFIEGIAKCFVDGEVYLFPQQKIIIFGKIDGVDKNNVLIRIKYIKNKY